MSRNVVLYGIVAVLFFVTAGINAFSKTPDLGSSAFWLAIGVCFLVIGITQSRRKNGLPPGRDNV